MQFNVSKWRNEYSKLNCGTFQQLGYEQQRIERRSHRVVFIVYFVWFSKRIVLTEPKHLKSCFVLLFLCSVCGACPPTTAQTTQFPGCCLLLPCVHCLRPDGECVGVSCLVFVKTHFLLKFRFITHKACQSKHSHRNHYSHGNTCSLVLVATAAIVQTEGGLAGLLANQSVPNTLNLVLFYWSNFMVNFFLQVS